MRDSYDEWWNTSNSSNWFHFKVHAELIGDIDLIQSVSLTHLNILTVGMTRAAYVWRRHICIYEQIRTLFGAAGLA